VELGTDLVDSRGVAHLNQASDEEGFDADEDERDCLKVLPFRGSGSQGGLPATTGLTRPTEYACARGLQA
jgi:hypothetical protein